MLDNDVNPKDQMVVTYSSEQIAGLNDDLQWVLHRPCDDRLDAYGTISGSWRIPEQSEAFLAQEDGDKD